LWLSIKAGLAATIIALVLGTLVAFGIHRFRFFGRDTVSLMLVLPIALPGIVTGLALQSAFNISHIELSIYTIIVGHATFCMVVVFNNVVARLRRTSTSLLEASSDLGARPVQTFRLVTLPMLSTAIIAGTLLAFALSFDEVIVTTFTAGAQNTLPLWIFGAILRGQQLPEVNAVVVGVLLLTAIPVAYAAKIASGDSAEVSDNPRSRRPFVAGQTLELVRGDGDDHLAARFARGARAQSLDRVGGLLESVTVRDQEGRRSSRAFTRRTTSVKASLV